MPRSAPTPSPTPPRHHGYGYIDPSAPRPLRALMAVYRFLASVKLAVISLSLLALALAVATVHIEKHYGTIAVNEWVYESTWFSILLGFLAANILCAALIRFPWKRRQTGFVVTHAGLLVLIFGAWWGFHYSDEGQAGAVEGGVVDKLIRTKHPIVRVQEVDGRGEAKFEYELPFSGGPVDWPEGRTKVISRPKDPFQVAVTGYFPAARPDHVERVAATGGAPMLRLAARAKAPRMPDWMDALGPRGKWLSLSQDRESYRTETRAGGARFAFLYVDRPELVDDFLNPPKDPGTRGVARLHYADRSGKTRTHEVRLDDAKPDEYTPLPGSDLAVAYHDEFHREGKEEDIDIVRFLVRKGDAPPVPHLGWAGRPMLPANFSITGDSPVGPPLLSVDYYLPPKLGGGGMSGTFGLVEVMGTPQGKLYYRVFGRDDAVVPPDRANEPRPGVIRKGPAPLKVGEAIVAFGGNPNQPMTLEFTAEDYLPSGQEKTIYARQPMPDGKQGDGLAAARVAITVGGDTQDVWVQRPAGLEMPPYTPVRVGGKDFKVAFDSEREDLGFSMVLKDFEVGYDPGTSKPARYTSEVLLTDQKAGIKDEPVTITMNHPLTHRQFTFYQSSFHPSESGDFVSVFQVGHDAGRTLKYIGSLMIVLGAFLQFYMKAGVFTAAGKTDDEKAADRARKLLQKKGEKAAGPEKKAKAKKTKSYDDAIL